MNSWKIFYPDEFTINDVYENAAFVYLIEFPDTQEYYIGVKQVYKGIKDVKNLNESTSESNWQFYNSSSTTVREYIAEGLECRKSILWCYKTVQEAMLAESTLIGVFGTDWKCLNKAIMVKTRLKKDNGGQREVLQRILGDLL